MADTNLFLQIATPASKLNIHNIGKRLKWKLNNVVTSVFYITYQLFARWESLISLTTF